jgi:hypothetical protein
MSVSAAIVGLIMMADAAPAAAPAAPVDPLDKVICRRLNEVGSLIQGKRICMTRREWIKFTEASRTAAEDMQVANGRLSGGNN